MKKLIKPEVIIDTTDVIMDKDLNYIVAAALADNTAGGCAPAPTQGCPVVLSPLQQKVISYLAQIEQYDPTFEGSQVDTFIEALFQLPTEVYVK